MHRKNIAGIAFAASALLLCAGAMAQANKCVNAAGKVTYTSSPCSDLGLKGLGEVKDRAGQGAEQKAPAAQSGSAPRAATSASKRASAGPAAAKLPAPATAERRCFVVKSGKGPVTRCNYTEEKKAAR